MRVRSRVENVLSIRRKGKGELIDSLAYQTYQVLPQLPWKTRDWNDEVIGVAFAFDPILQR